MERAVEESRVIPAYRAELSSVELGHGSSTLTLTHFLPTRWGKHARYSLYDRETLVNVHLKLKISYYVMCSKVSISIHLNSQMLDTPFNDTIVLFPSIHFPTISSKKLGVRL